MTIIMIDKGLSLIRRAYQLFYSSILFDDQRGFKIISIFCLVYEAIFSLIFIAVEPCAWIFIAEFDLRILQKSTFL